MRKIKAKVIANDAIVEVKQSSPGSEYFLDDNNNPYGVKELDFTVTEDKPIQTTEDEEESMARMSGMFIPGHPSIDEIKKSNDLTLALDKERKRLDEKMLKLTFKCQLVTTMITQSHNMMSVADVMGLVNLYASQVFDNNNTLTEDE